MKQEQRYQRQNQDNNHIGLKILNFHQMVNMLPLDLMVEQPIYKFMK